VGSLEKDKKEARRRSYTVDPGGPHRVE